MSKRITRKMLEKSELENLGKHQMKIADFNKFALDDITSGLMRKISWKPGLNVTIWFPYNDGWIIKTTEIDPDDPQYTLPGTAKDWHVSNDEMIEFEILPYYTI